VPRGQRDVRRRRNECVPSPDGNITPDRPLTKQEEEIAAALSPDFLLKLDKALLSLAGSRGKKVAMIVGLALNNPELQVPGLPDVYYARRIRLLVEKGTLLGIGNTDFMRYSEVRIP
jgi:hypothetical protein